jgi:hypothetical protein
MNAAATQPDGSLPEARRHLDYAIHALIEPQPHTLHRDDGTTPITWIDPIIDQLYDAVAGQSGERSGQHSTMPVWADVMILLTDIEKDCAKWSPEWPQPDVGSDHPTPPTIARLQELQARKWRVEDTAYINTIRSTIEAHTQKAKELLIGQRIRYIYEPDSGNLVACPSCGRSYVHRRDNSGQIVRQPALQISPEGTTHCVNRECEAQWGPEKMLFLGRLLGFEKPSYLLE